MMWWTVALALAAPPSLTEPVRTGMTSPQDAAVLIGIEDYAFLPDVPHARRDLDAMSDLLIYTRGVPPERVRRLRGANREQILSAVEGARGDLGPDGTLWVYFAGHGAADPSTSSLLLVGDDAKPDPVVFSQRSVSVDSLTASLPDGSVLILDTCWAGAARGDTPLIPDSRFAVPTWAVEAPEGVTVWSASAPDEIAGAYHPARHGAFTYFVVGALRGWADGELSGTPDGEVDLQEAHAWVGRALSAAGIRDQTPTLRGARPGALTLGNLQAPPSLQDLPSNEHSSAILGILSPHVHGSTPAPATLPAVATFHEAGFQGPVSHTEKWRFEDGNGRPLPFATVFSLVGGTAEGDALSRRLLRMEAGRLGGTSLIVAGGASAAISAAFFGEYHKAKRNDRSCGDPGVIEALCIQEDKMLITGTVLLSSGVIAGVAGWIVAKTRGRKIKRQIPEVVDAANERLGL